MRYIATYINTIRLLEKGYHTVSTIETQKIHYALFKFGSIHAQEDCSQSMAHFLAKRTTDEINGNDKIATRLKQNQIWDSSMMIYNYRSSPKGTKDSFPLPKFFS